MFKTHFNKFLLTSVLWAIAFCVHAESVDALFHRSDDPIIGKAENPVTIVEFFDYQCSHCARMAPVIATVIKANPQVRFIFKDYPIRGAISEFAARAALAANMQGKYYEFNHALLTSSRSLSKESILAIAKSLDLNISQLQKDLKSKKITAQLNENINLARQLRITGTPSFYIGKTNTKSQRDVQYVLGEMSVEELQSAIDKANSN